MKLQFKPGAPTRRILWTAYHELMEGACSLCRTPFDDDEQPFRIMGETRTAAFCGACFALCFEASSDA